MDREAYKGIPDGLGIYTHDVITGKMTVNQARERLKLDGMKHIEAPDLTSTVEMKLHYLGLLEKLHQEGPDGYRKIIANRINKVCDQIEQELGLGEKETVNVANLTCNLSVSTPPEFDDQVERMKHVLDEVKCKAIEMAAQIAESMKNIKVTVS
ncbi:hypothetical protein [Paenibacillus cineris]|uniref:Uncharacterized protein n=1 Tax=Paenibacillus cineris TaxID=237530 RepID=A0ABQ4LN13_9BACL|nr:hypothetical protein [Paenibacillus cineris]GIO57903.1 hypothetical protein J21TS7_62210 [Paenibacillus cineris]